ncbi:hypothetical protein [Nonomuraea roseoviolacea]|uniref:hypothetical protein n=1 Tax=Nonomuraea roseoviolacea TaxID=103837 RepID=UPI0031D37460
MKHIAKSAAAALLCVPALSLPALSPSAPALASDRPAWEHTAGELRNALLTTDDGLSGYEVRHVATGTAARFLAGRTRQRSWAGRLVPARCRTSATAGLLFDPAKVARFPDAPAAAVEMWGDRALGEALVSVPGDLPRAAVEGRLPRGCGAFRARHGGKTITIRVRRLSEDVLPDIPGATVSGFKRVTPAGVWGNTRPGETNLIVVRSGRLVLETFTDAFGPVDAYSAEFTLKAWRQALERLR